MRKYKTMWAFCGLAALFAMPVFGQTFGEITGRVSDSSGAVVPGATITLTNVNTSATRITQSTNAGDYTFPSVPPVATVWPSALNATASPPETPRRVRRPSGRPWPATRSACSR